MPPPLRIGTSIAELQSYVATLERERGFAEQSVVQKCLLLGEELGELFKAVRKSHGDIAYDDGGHDADAPGELADVVIVLCAIANRLGVDLAQAVISKEERKAGRAWQ